MGFLDGHASVFGSEEVTIIKGKGTASEKRVPSRAQLQANSGFFDVDTPIYEGDYVEAADPRGGTREFYAQKVDVNGGNGSPTFEALSHIQAHWGQPPSTPRPTSPSSVTYNGPVVQIHGDHAAVAFDQGTVNQSSQQVDDRYVELTKAVGALLERLEQFPQEDRDVVKEAADSVLLEVVKANPEQSVLRRAVYQLRGFLGMVSAGAAGAAGKDIAQWAGSLAERMIVP